MLSIKHLQDASATGIALYKRYQPHISAASMVVGFGIDNYTFGRIDRPAANIILMAYILVAALSIAFAHFLEARADRIKARLARKARFSNVPLTRAQKLAARRKDIRIEPKVATVEPQNPVAQTEAGAAQAGAQPAAAAMTTVFEPTKDEAETKSDDPTKSRLRTLLPAAAQFAFGSLWSGFLVFYSRSAVLAASWPFMLLLLGFFVGNETFRKYHSRLVFSSLLLFFAIYSYAILVMPVFTRSIGRLTFILSGIVAIAAFFMFLRLLKAVGAERFRQSRLALFGGAIAIFAAMNAFYFLDVLPPLPLALMNVGVFHSVKHVGNVYDTVGEPQTLSASYGLTPQAVHVEAGKPLYIYSAVFAPIKLSTRIAHRWQWFDEKRKHWITESVVSFPINGGREGGYRAYSIKSNPKPGDWRVDIRTDDNRLIGRIRFSVAAATGPLETVAKTFD